MKIYKLQTKSFITLGTGVCYIKKFYGNNIWRIKKDRVFATVIYRQGQRKYIGLILPPSSINW
jgi:hypothetical protein